MTVLTIIGAGSTVFAAELMTDFLSAPGLDAGEFRLVDIDAERLALAHRFADYLIERSGRDWTVKSSVDRTELLPGSTRRSQRQRPGRLDTVGTATPSARAVRICRHRSDRPPACAQRRRREGRSETAWILPCVQRTAAARRDGCPSPALPKPRTTGSYGRCSGSKPGAGGRWHRRGRATIPARHRRR